MRLNFSNSIPSYIPPNRELWKGRVDANTPQRFHEIIQCHDWNSGGIPKQSKALQFALIGFCSDEGVKRNQGRIGAIEGPEAFRKAFASIPIHAQQPLSFFDLGNVVCTNGDLEQAQSTLATIITTLLHDGIFPIVIGGGHELAWGHFQGIRNAFVESAISIVNFDAHFDLRPIDSLGTSGTSFTQIADECNKRNLPFRYTCFGIQHTGNTKFLFERADSLGVEYVYAQEFYLKSEKIGALVDKITRSQEKIYCTICLDVFSASIAPGVSAPQPLGIHPWHLLSTIQSIISSKKLVALDIAELNPRYDLDGSTARLAAHLIGEIIRMISIVQV